MITIHDLIGEAAYARLEQQLTQAEAENATRNVTVWCPENKFVVGVTVHFGKPTSFIFRGPLEELVAAAFMSEYLAMRVVGAETQRDGSAAH